MITVIGLGAEADLGKRARGALAEADEVLLRTARIGARALEEEGIAYETLDFLYGSSRNYDTFTRKVVREIARRGKTKKVAYVVDGSVTEDEAAKRLIERGAAAIDGVPKSAHYALRAGVGGNYTACSAFSLTGETALPLVLYDLTRDNVSDAKLLLSEKYGDETPVVAFTEEGEKRIPLYELDRVSPCGAVLLALPLLEKKKFTFEDFVAILKRLRAPDGCPWDRVQTHESLRVNCIEEAYELVDAIDRKDPARMQEEAGDVLMQAVFHTLIEEEKGGFSVADMLTGVCTKLITRHTHVFGKDKATGAEGALSVWDKNKMAEKGQKTYSDAVNDVPECFPALLRAQKIAKRMEKGGWDEATFENFERKFREEYGELREAVRSGERERISEELGDALFCAVELGRAAGEDCEMALLDTVKKMQKRYTAYEALVRADGKDVHALSQEEKNEYYRRAKHAT